MDGIDENRHGPHGIPVPIIDCDVHQTWKHPDEITQHLPPRYRDWGVVTPTLLYQNPGGFHREDVLPPDGDPPGSDIDNIQEHLLDEIDPEFVVLTGDSGLDLTALPNRDYAAALARAYNKWQIDTWLSRGDPFVGSLFVAPQAPNRSAELIRELGTHPRIVQILVPGAAQIPYGQPYYWPIYEAAQEVGLPIAIHPFYEGHGIKSAPTGAGQPNMYLEWHTLLGAYYMGQLASIITEGVFSQFPDLKFVFIEGGFGWVPHFMWRMDKNWKALRSQAPWLKKPPSEYIIENVWFTTQPIEEPAKPKHLRQILEMMNAEKTLMFSSDYPHWDGDSPKYGFPPLPEHLQERIFYENAAEVYDLPGGKPTGRNEKR